MLNIANYVQKGNKIDTFINTYNSSPHQVALFGLGGSIDIYLKLLKKYKIKVDYIIDNNSNIWGTTYNNIPIESADILLKFNTLYIIISAPSHLDSIINQIKSLSNRHIIIQFDPSLEIIQENNYKERRDFYLSNADYFQSFYNILSDNLSKLTLEKTIEGALTSNYYCYNEIATNNQYFPDIIMSNLTDKEVFLDIGAYTGDSSLEFIDAVKNNYSKIIGFEPKEENIKQAIQQINDNRVSFYPYGVGEKNEHLYLYGEDGLDDFAHISNKQNDNCTEITIVSIDDFIKEPYTYLKMDIEGMEIDALRGARKTIENYHPKLAISVYHKIDDLITIPNLIQKIDSSYKLYLRHYWKYCGTDTVLFAL